MKSAIFLLLTLSLVAFGQERVEQPQNNEQPQQQQLQQQPERPPTVQRVVANLRLNTIDLHQEINALLDSDIQLEQRVFSTLTTMNPQDERLPWFWKEAPKFIEIGVRTLRNRNYPQLKSRVPGIESDIWFNRLETQARCLEDSFTGNFCPRQPFSIEKKIALVDDAQWRALATANIIMTHAAKGTDMRRLNRFYERVYVDMEVLRNHPAFQALQLPRQRRGLEPVQFLKGQPTPAPSGSNGQTPRIEGSEIPPNPPGVEAPPQPNTPTPPEPAIDVNDLKRKLRELQENKPASPQAKPQPPDINERDRYFADGRGILKSSK